MGVDDVEWIGTSRIDVCGRTLYMRWDLIVDGGGIVATCRWDSHSDHWWWSVSGGPWFGPHDTAVEARHAVSAAWRALELAE